MNTTCITKSWLNNKSQELGIAASAIESIAHEYINQQGNDNFPTDDYIKQQFVPKSSMIDDQDYYDNLIKVYNNIGGETIYSDEQEAIIAQNRALKSFPDESVTLMPTNDGKYIVRIAQPINKNYEKELQDILAKAPRDSQGRLLAPNGKPSNLTERQYAQVRTKEFKEWFGDWENNPENASKVVDENGEPLVVYHNDKQFYKDFKQKLLNSNTDRIYFSPFKGKWKNFSGDIETLVFLNIRNPRYGDIEINNIANFKDNDGLILDLDGIIEEYIVNNPNQIKSAESNIGTFSTTNDRIDRFTEGKISDIIDNQPDKITDGTNYYTQDDINYLHSRNLSINQTFTGDNIKQTLESFKSSILKTINEYLQKNHYDLGVATQRRQKLEGNLSDINSYYNFIQQLQNTIIDKLQKAGKTIEIKPDNSFTAAMGAKVNGNVVSLVYNPRLLLMDYERLDYILAHELVHTVTSNSINNATLNTATKEEKQFYDDIWNIIVDLNDNKNFYWDFGYNVFDATQRGSHIKEFIANVMTNPELQKSLAQIKTDKKQSLWSRFINAIKGLLNKYLGINISNSYLEKLVNTISLHIEKTSLQNQNFRQFDMMTEGEKVSDKNTFKGKEEEEKTITFASDSQKESYNNFVEKQRELGTIIKFNPKDHSYIIDGVRNDFSVTEYRDFIRTGKRKDGKKSFWFEVSGRLGNTHDEMLRDFFNGEMKDSYTNISTNQLKAFEKEAQKLKEELQQEFGRDAIFITDEDLLRVAATINNDGNNYLVAGTMDMIVIDNKGTIHIVDFKTKRANADKDLDEGKLKGYNQQVNLYKQLLSKKLGIDIGTTRVAQFNVKYTADESDKYTYQGNQIYYKGKKIQIARNRQGQYIYEAGTFYDTIEFEEDLSEDLFDEILPIETKLQQLKDSKDKYASDFEMLTDEDFDDAKELIEGLNKKSSKKSQRKKQTQEKATKTKSEIQKLEEAIVNLTKEIKELKEGKKEKDKRGGQEEEKDTKQEQQQQETQEWKEARLKEIQQKLEYKKVELQQVQQQLQEFVDDFYELELQEEKGNYTAQYILSMDKFLTGTIDDEAKTDKTIISNDIKKQKLKQITLCMPLSSLLTLDTSYVNYNLLFTLDELLKNNFLFPVGPSEKIELSDDLKLIAESMKKENKKFPYDSKTGVLQVPKFTVGYTQKEILKRNQRNQLLSTDLFTQAQLRQLAKATIYKVSEIITKIHDNLNGYTYYFGREEGDPNVSKDFTKMSRIEIIQTIGLGRLIDQVREGREAVFDVNNFDVMNTPFELLEKIDFINQNWDAFIDLGYDTLINLEEIALDDRNTTADLKNDVNTLFEDNDESVIQELFGSSIEHWQVGFRQVSAINSLSKQLKIVLDSFYQVDKDGEIITDDLGIGIGKHLNSQEAAAKILYYTQGARSIDDMVKLLKNQIDVEPWIEQLMPYIEDQYDREGNLTHKADETFRSQFYSNFKKYFQKYAITFKNKKTNKIEIKVVNESSYTDSLMDSVKALENSATLGKYHLRTKDNKLNEETLKKLKELKGQLDSFAKLASSVKGSINDNKNFDLNKFHEVLHQVYDLLNIDTPNNEQFYKIFSVKNNIKLLAGKLGYLISTIEKNKEDINNKGKAITDIKDYKNIAEIVGKYMGLEMESVTYEAGKMYYSYVLPSYLGRLVSKLRGENLSDEEYADVLEKEYLQYPQFKKDNKIRCYWLERLIHKPKAREMFQHITSLHYLGVEYTNKTPVEYIASMMRAYFYDDNAEWAYYRVPTLSNKPSEEYIRFIRVQKGYEQFVIDHLVDTFTYELDRIQAVRTRRDTLDEDKKIKNFDTFVEKDKDGKVVKVKKGNGEKFVFLDWVQPYLDKSFKNTKEYKIAEKQAKEGDEKAQKLLENMQEFSDLINRKLDDKMSNENADNANLLTLFKEIAKVSLESKYQDARQYWEKEGFLTKKSVEKNGRTVETTEIFGFSNKDNITDESLREFFFNDMLAAINILQLTVGDTAYYKDTEDLQKRLAQIHAPGMQANIYARDSEGNRYSDGFERTMYIADDVVKSELISNLKVAMNNILSEYDKESKQYTILKNQFKFVLDTAKEINVADAQGFSCLTSHRKKLALFGEWTDRMEEAYLQLTEPELFEDASLTDILDVLLQPIKPFVYTQIAKKGYNDSLSKLKVGIQNKNSEYVIALVDAILKKGNQPNKLRAIYQFMEDSQKNGKGIDTIQFESTVKAGLTGVINLNGDMSEEEVYRVLQNHLYNTDGTYNTDYVHEIPFEDYIIQQNVPSHFRDHEQAHGSQNRILTVADLQDKDKDGNTNYITIDGRNVTVEQAKKDYFKAIADNIQLSVDRVIKRFKLDSFDQRQRNIALSRILKDAILKDSRFGADLYWACDTNEYGEFNIPLSDPIHSNRIQQLLNSIIKNAINKQEIAGGPVVQATSWGLSDDLHIRFRAYSGQILLTEEEFYTENYPTDYETGNYLPKGDYESYEKYVEDNQESVAYFECYVPIQDKNIALDFTRKDEEGNEYIDVEEMKKANPKLLEMIGYRIPTESKYSMVPIKVKGFVNNMSGELIMMPKEITWLSGSDFDKI